MTRIIAGQAGGRRLRVPAQGTRPTSDRVREACFSSLESQLRSEDVTWPQVDVLDLYAGSGALGLEALSRGARSAVLVERSREAIGTLRANIEAVGMAGARIVDRDVDRLASMGDSTRVAATLVFVDPPYELAASAVRGVLEALLQAGWIGSDALVVVERASKDRESPLPDDWIQLRQRAFGDTTLWYGRATHRESQDDHQEAG